VSILSSKNITKIYGDQSNTSSTIALNGITLDIESDEFAGVMGPSGSGKTTLLQILGGITRPTTGSVEIRSKNLVSLDKYELALFRRRQLGFVFQEFNLLDSLTLKENVMLPLILDKKGITEMEARAKEIMTLFGIQDIANKYPYNVSGGQQQKTAICRSLVNNPALVLADEPTGNLDSKSSKAVLECFERMNHHCNCTILMVTHDPFAASYCRKIIFIKDGSISFEIVRKGDRKEFFDRILDCLAVLGGDKE